MIIAIIPARGGSKRIPKKNIVEFAGKPMIAWTIEAALESRIFDSVVVSTDSEEIAETAQQFGAQVPFLRTRCYDDECPVSSVTIDALQEIEARLNRRYDTVIQLMANCPLRGSADIVASYNNFIARGFEFQLSACEYGWLNPWWAFQLSAEYAPTPLFPDALTKRSQELTELYCPSGAIWIARIRSLFRNGTFYGKDYKIFPIDWRSAVDIDDESDLAFARALYALKVSDHVGA